MKVLLTSDGSKQSEQAIRWFSQLPLSSDNTLELITVGSYQAFDESVLELYDEYQQWVRKNASEAFQRAQSILSTQGKSAVHIDCIGHPADEITRYARIREADLIVMGALGSSMLSRMLLGSTSDSVAMHAPCSVLVVRGTEHYDWNPHPHVVTVALDGSESSQQALEMVRNLGLPAETRIRLVSVVESPENLQLPYAMERIRSAQLMLDKFEIDVLKSFRHVEKHVLEKHHVGAAITDFVQQHPTELLVMGCKGRSAISRFFVGSVARFALHHACCSLLLVRPKT